MAQQDTRQKGASLKALMDEVVKLNVAVADLGVADGLPRLADYRWRPGTVDAPAIYNLLGAAPMVQKDQVLWAENLIIHVRIAVAYGDDASEAGLLERYIDIFRNVWDPALIGAADSRIRPFDGAAIWAKRDDMRTVPEEFNGIPYAAMEFPSTIRMDRFIP